MPMRSQSASASSREWVVKMRAREDLARVTASQRRRREAGSRPVEGWGAEGTGGGVETETEFFCQVFAYKFGSVLPVFSIWYF